MSAVPRLIRAVRFPGSRATRARNVATASSPAPLCRKARPRLFCASAEAGFQSNRRLEVLDRAVGVTRLLQRDAEVQVHERQCRSVARRGAQLLDRVRETAFSLQCQPQVVTGLGMRGAKPHRRLERGEGAVEIVGPPSRRAEVILRVEQVRLELNRALECGQRVSGQAEATEDEAEAIVGRGQCGILADGILVGRARRGQIVLALRGESLLIQSFGGGSARSLRSLRQREHRREEHQTHDVILSGCGYGGEPLPDQVRSAIDSSRLECSRQKQTPGGVSPPPGVREIRVIRVP